MRRRRTGQWRKTLGGQGERGRKGLTVTRGTLDDVPLFRRYSNVARCDIAKDVELGCKHIQGAYRMLYGLSEGAGPEEFQVVRLSSSGDSDRESAMAWALIVEDCLVYLSR